jgi:hypothetical protein
MSNKEKQIKASIKRAKDRDFKLKLILFLSVLSVMLTSVLCICFFTGVLTVDKVIGITTVAGGGASYAVAGMFVIPEVPNSERQGGQVSAEIICVRATEVENVPKMNANREIGTVSLKSNATVVKIRGVLDNTIFTLGGENGDIASNTTQTLKTVVGGLRVETLNFIEKSLGLGFIVFFKTVDGNTYILGDDIKSAKLGIEEGGFLAENTSIPLTFTQKNGLLLRKYVGTLPDVAPTTVAPDATSLAIGSADVYKLEGGSSTSVKITTVSGIQSGDIGRKITISGLSDSNPPKIESSDTFFLRDGVAFDGAKGESITFEIFDTNSLVEVSRS